MDESNGQREEEEEDEVACNERAAGQDMQGNESFPWPRPIYCARTDTGKREEIHFIIWIWPEAAVAVAQHPPYGKSNFISNYV